MQSDLGYSSGDELVRNLSTLADLIITCQGLATGYSREVHGQMIISHGQAAAASLILSKVTDIEAEHLFTEPMNLQFKVLDSAVDFFGKGLSSAVV